MEKLTGKTAIIFPGLGYHSDKPLLYFSKKLARESGYKIVETSYGGFPYGIKGNPEKMRMVFESALAQAEEILKDYDFTEVSDVLILSKSVGTVVAAAWQKKHSIPAKNIYFTPVEGTFEFMPDASGIAFHGTADSWVTTEIVTEGCKKLQIPLYLTEGAEHSMEVENNKKDL